MFDFTGKNILVTGGRGGIGSAIVELFKQYNGNVITTNSDKYSLQSKSVLNRSQNSRRFCPLKISIFYYIY